MTIHVLSSIPIDPTAVRTNGIYMYIYELIISQVVSIFVTILKINIYREENIANQKLQKSSHMHDM